MGVATRFNRVFIFVATQFVKSIANFEPIQIGAYRAEKLRTASKPSQAKMLTMFLEGGGVELPSTNGCKPTLQTLQSGMGTGDLENFPALIGGWGKLKPMTAGFEKV